MDEGVIAWQTEFETTGKAWIGQRKASGAFVKLRARADELSITTPIGSISFSPREVVAFRPMKGVFGFGGFEIVHTVDRRSVQFWSHDGARTLERIVATGFVPRGVAGGGPDPARRTRHDEENRAGNRRLFKFFGILAAVFVAIFGAIFVGVTFGLSHSELYETTWATVQVDPRVVDVVGSPVVSGSPSGSVHLVGSDGTATIAYDVSGPKGRGAVQAEGTKTAGVWHVDRFVFAPDGGAERSIDLSITR
jgi:hypothetical protein